MVSELSIARSSWLFGGFKSTKTFLGSTFGEVPVDRHFASYRLRMRP